MSKLVLGIVAATAAAAGAALVAGTPAAAPPTAAPSTQAIGVVRPPIDRTPIIVEPADPPIRTPPIDRPPIVRPPHLPPPPPPPGVRVIPLPLCSYDSDVTSSVALYSDWWNDDYGTAFLCKADVNGQFNAACGSDASAATSCPASTRGRPAASHYILTENLYGLDGAYGSGWSYADGSALYGTYYGECQRAAGSCNDTLVIAKSMGQYIPGNYPVFTPTKAKLFDLDGGVMPYAGKVKASVKLGWYGACTTCGPGVGPQSNDVVLAIQVQKPDMTWADVYTRTFTSGYNTRALMEAEIAVDAGKHVRFQLRGENAGDQPHFGYAYDSATLSVPVPLVGRENHLRLCEYQPEELGFDHFFRDAGAPFVCRGNINWNGCALDPYGHPLDTEYRLRAVGASTILPPTEMAWSDGSALHGVEEVVCHHLSWIPTDEVYQSFVKPSAATCTLVNNASTAVLAEVDGGFIEHSRPVTVVGAARLRGNSYYAATLALQVLTPDATGMVAWQDVGTTRVTLDSTSLDQPTTVTATVAPYSDVRLQVRGDCGQEFQVLSASVFSECDPTDPYSCNP
jgi:hypothetical protein